MKTPTTNEFRHRINIESATITVDEYGQPIRTWTTVASLVPAKMETKRSARAWIADQENAEFETVFTVRYRTIYEDQYRINYNGQQYRIDSVVDPVGLRKHLEIRCSLVSNTGYTV